jgi:hypothetical protein
MFSFNNNNTYSISVKIIDISHRSIDYFNASIPKVLYNGI